MKLSKYFYVTLRETPSDATMPSHIFLMRGGYIKPVSTGIYSMMPMGFRVIQKIVNIIREEMNKIGGIEVDLPVVQTAELWRNRAVTRPSAKNSSASRTATTTTWCSP